MSNNRKKIFLNNPSSGTQRSAKELPPIIHGYEEKHKIAIHFNGETPQGENIIKNREDDFNQLIANLSDEKNKYAAYLQAFWKKGYAPFRIDPEAYAWNLSEKFKSAISDFLETDGSFKKSISYPELASILKDFPEYLKMIDSKIENAIKFTKRLRDDACLEKYEARTEIAFIQDTLAGDEMDGYVYTNNHRQEKSHVEVFIIKKDSVYRPADWAVDSFEKLFFKDTPKETKGKFIDADLRQFIKGKVTWYSKDYFSTLPYLGEPPFAQASGIECATLGMIYLKELLKNNGELLREFSLTIPYYDKDGNENYLFFPPPQILRYSQSGVYNKAVKEMIANDSEEPVILDDKKEKIHKEYAITTIKAILEKTKLDAQDKPNGKQITDECNALLKRLAEFKNKWLEAYATMEKNRNAMNDQKGINRYLSYKSENMPEKILTHEESEYRKEKFQKIKLDHTNLEEHSRENKKEEKTEEKIEKQENKHPIDSNTTHNNLLSSHSLLKTSQSTAEFIQQNKTAMTQTSQIGDQTQITPKKIEPLKSDQKERILHRQKVIGDILTNLKNISKSDAVPSLKKARADMIFENLMKGSYLTSTSAEYLKSQLKLSGISIEIVKYISEKIEIEIDKLKHSDNTIRKGPSHS